ncbi:hypothetical protein HHK36_007995 [Tetracentron sinense]|uniref:Uncharacterized protein n=1 Tax=Tetracentron sinense TaxID=13715 RepID=A0A835DMT8_TETSI|nr:hypothetical protein HHK36_007995 [Tetracentron sinense]
MSMSENGEVAEDKLIYLPWTGILVSRIESMPKGTSDFRDSTEAEVFALTMKKNIFKLCANTTNLEIPSEVTDEVVGDKEPQKRSRVPILEEESLLPKSMSPPEELHIDAGSSVPEVSGSAYKPVLSCIKEVPEEIQTSETDPRCEIVCWNLLAMVVEYEVDIELSTGQHKHPKDGGVTDHRVEDHHKASDYKEVKLLEFAEINGFAETIMLESVLEITKEVAKVNVGAYIISNEPMYGVAEIADEKENLVSMKQCFDCEDSKDVKEGEKVGYLTQFDPKELADYKDLSTIVWMMKELRNVELGDHDDDHRQEVLAPDYGSADAILYELVFGNNETEEISGLAVLRDFICEDRESLEQGADEAAEEKAIPAIMEVISVVNKSSDFVSDVLLCEDSEVTERKDNLGTMEGSFDYEDSNALVKEEENVKGSVPSVLDEHMSENGEVAEDKTDLSTMEGNTGFKDRKDYTEDEFFACATPLKPEMGSYSSTVSPVNVSPYQVKLQWLKKFINEGQTARIVLHEEPLTTNLDEPIHVEGEIVEEQADVATMDQNFDPEKSNNLSEVVKPWVPPRSSTNLMDFHTMKKNIFKLCDIPANTTKLEMACNLTLLLKGEEKSSTVVPPCLKDSGEVSDIELSTGQHKHPKDGGVTDHGVEDHKASDCNGFSEAIMHEFVLEDYLTESKEESGGSNKNFDHNLRNLKKLVTEVYSAETCHSALATTDPLIPSIASEFKQGNQLEVQFTILANISNSGDSNTTEGRDVSDNETEIEQWEVETLKDVEIEMFSQEKDQEAVWAKKDELDKALVEAEVAPEDIGDHQVHGEVDLTVVNISCHPVLNESICEDAKVADEKANTAAVEGNFYTDDGKNVAKEGENAGTSSQIAREDLEEKENLVNVKQYFDCDDSKDIVKEGEIWYLPQFAPKDLANYKEDEYTKDEEFALSPQISPEKVVDHENYKKKVGKMNCSADSILDEPLLNMMELVRKILMEKIRKEVFVMGIVKLLSRRKKMHHLCHKLLLVKLGDHDDHRQEEEKTRVSPQVAPEELIEAVLDHDFADSNGSELAVLRDPICEDSEALEQGADEAAEEKAIPEIKEANFNCGGY